MASLISRLRTTLNRHDRGSELVELAIALPIFLVIVAGIMDFGFLFQRWEVLTNAAREGARIGTLPGYSQADVQARVQDYLTQGGLTATIPTPSVLYTTQTLSTGNTVDVVKVTVQYPSSFPNLGAIIGLIRGTGPAAITLQASSTMRLEGAAGAGGT
jgi:Flp pilus assembly protein TadG